MIVTFYSLLKRSNSTKRPTDGGVQIDCLLKDGTSRHDPIFRLSLDEMPTWNMCTAFDNAYYRVVNVVAVHNGLYDVECTIDLFATHKNSIENTPQFIAYAKNGFTDITDSRNPPSTKCEIFTQDNGTPFTFEGTYVLVVASADGSQGAGVSAAYAMTYGEINSLAAKLYDESLLEEISKYFTQPMNAIISCTYLPLSGIGGTSSTVKFGKVDSGISAHKLNTGYGSRSFTITLPYYSAFPDESFNYIWCRPYTTLLVNLPGVGIVEIDRKGLTGNSISATMDYSQLTGDLVWTLVDASSSSLIASFSGACGQAMPVSSASTDIASRLSGFLNMVGGATSAFANPAGGLSTMVSGAVQIIDSFKQNVQINGSISSAVGTRGILSSLWSMLLVNRPHASATEYSAVQGLPVFKVGSVPAYGGYVRTVGASLPSVAELSEIDELCSLMDGGFYYE